MPDFARRRDLVRRQLRAQNLQALLVTHPVNVTYLSGFSGEDSYLLVTDEHATIISDPRFSTQLAEECPDLELAIRSPGTSLATQTIELLASHGLSTLGFEPDHLSVAAHQQLVTGLPTVVWRAAPGIVETLREVKDKEEIATLRQAIWSAEKAFGMLRAGLRAGRTEKETADDLEHQMRLFGASRASFPTIVAAGERAALPHARPSDRPIGPGEFVLVDWGAVRGGYHSDLTRVLATSKIPPKLERVYGVVLKAQARAIAAIRPGASGHEIDAAAREVIAGAGFGKCFGHGLGHGIGLEIHEGPRLSRNQHRPLRPGMVVTVEPGIYLPGWGGVRIEDDVLVTRTGGEVLSTLPHGLDELVY